MKKHMSPYGPLSRELGAASSIVASWRPVPHPTSSTYSGRRSATTSRSNASLNGYIASESSAITVAWRVTSSRPGPPASWVARSR